jgi:hypothetical protein
VTEEPVFGDRYRILWRSVRPGCVAEVRNYAIDRRGYRTVPVRLADSLMQRISMRFVATSWGERGPEIMVSKAFMALPMNFREAAIWHEVGHIHYEHHFHFQLEFQDQSQLRAARISAVQKGEVMPHETQADRFATERVGKDAFTGFLGHLLKTRPRGKGWNDIGSRELELRIAIIDALDSCEPAS